MTPIVHWAGSKTWAAAHVRRLWEQMGRGPIIEPFAGSAAVTFACEPEMAWLNDRDPHLMNLYRHVQRGATIDPSLMGITTREAYYQVRAAFNERIRMGGVDDTAAASQFYYLNCHAFNHLTRYNSSGAFNTPFRDGKSTRLGWKQTIPHLWQLTTGDWRDVLNRLSGPVPATCTPCFYFVDPPYDGTYSFGKFNWGEQVALATALKAITEPVVAMNAPTDRVRQLYGDLGFHTTELASGQQWHRSRGESAQRRELIFTNFEVS